MTVTSRGPNGPFASSPSEVGAGIVENIWARGLICKDMQREVAIMNMAYSADTREAQNTKAPVFRDIHISRIMGEGAPVAIKINALPDSPVENIFFQDIFIKSQKGVQCNFAKNVSFVHAHDHTAGRGLLFQLGHCQDITLLDCGASPGTGRVSGRDRYRMPQHPDL